MAERTTPARGLILFILMMLFVSSRADTIPERSVISKVLIREGFENLHILYRSDTLWVAAENRRYRFDPAGYAHLVNALMPEAGVSAVLAVTILKRGIPVGWFTMSKKDWSGMMQDTLPVNTAMNPVGAETGVPSAIAGLAAGSNLHPSFNKLDFVIYPQVKIQLGNFDDPFQSQFNLAPSMEISFVRGMNLMAQVIIPLQNDLEPNGNSVRPGIISLSQLVRLPWKIYALASVGYFTRNRYGLNAEFRRFFMKGKITAGFTGGLTGYAEFIENAWQYSDVDLFTWFADAGYRWAKYDLTLKAGYGRFTDGGNGWRFDAYRQFREITIGVFALQTEGFTNGGFYFRIPLPPGRYNTRSVVRIRPESYFSYEYRARGLADAGKYYSVGSSLTDLFHNCNPDFLRNEIIKVMREQKVKTEKK